MDHPDTLLFIIVMLNFVFCVYNQVCLYDFTTKISCSGEVEMKHIRMNQNQHLCIQEAQGGFVESIMGF